MFAVRAAEAFRRAFLQFYEEVLSDVRYVVYRDKFSPSDSYMLPNTLRPLVTDNETTTTLNTKKTRPKRVVRALHHCRFRFALAIVRPKRSACVTSSVKSKSSPKPRIARRPFQSFAFNGAIVSSVDDPTSLHSSCWNNVPPYSTLVYER